MLCALIFFYLVLCILGFEKCYKDNGTRVELNLFCLQNSFRVYRVPTVCLSLTICGFLSGEWVAVFAIVGGDHGDLVERLWTQTL